MKTVLSLVCLVGYFACALRFVMVQSIIIIIIIIV